VIPIAVVSARLSRVRENTTTGVLTAEFRRLRLHPCGFWNRTIVQTFRRGRRSLLMTLRTTVNCATNYVGKADEGLKYFIAIRRMWAFNAYNYNLRRGDKVIRRGYRPVWFFPSSYSVNTMVFNLLSIWLFWIVFMLLCETILLQLHTVRVQEEKKPYTLCLKIIHVTTSSTITWTVSVRL